MNKRENISPFSIILITIAIAIVGFLSARRLSINYTPQEKSESITVRFYFQEASSRIVEERVTTIIEGALSKLNNNIGTSSLSSKGYGRVTVNFKRGTDMRLARFEVATQIRNIYNSLPKGVSYPDISLGTSGGGSKEMIGFQIKGDMPTNELYKYAQDALLKPLSEVKGVDKLELRGNTPFHWEIKYDPYKIASNEIEPDEIVAAIRDYYSVEVVGIAQTKEKEKITVYLKIGDTAKELGDIPIKKNKGRIIYLSDIATISFKESEPTSYYRINGLNTISLTIYSAENSNNIEVAARVKDLMKELSEKFPPSISYSLDYDSSIYIKTELNKIYRRTFLSLIILLLFIFITYRSFRYLLVVGLTIVINILIAIVLYYLLDLQIHIYSLAGITVSLGIIIDAAIVMTDHYSYYKNRSAFFAIFGAIITTIASLMAVFLLPYNERLNLTDFTAAISINLFISLLVAYFFVPALINYKLAEYKFSEISYKRFRRVVKWNRIYRKYITKTIRFKWLFVILIIAGFGIPVCLIPSKTDMSYSKDVKYSSFVKKIANWEPYVRNKTTIDRVLSSSFGVFYRSLSRYDLNRQPERKVLYIHTGLSEGHTIEQLNVLVKEMENFLSKFKEIELFKTNIYSYSSADIQVYFKREFEKNIVPSIIKSEVIKAATNFGGANWEVSGIDDKSFNNYVGSVGWRNSIDMFGYNYDELISYAEYLASYLSRNPRVQNAQVVSSGFSSPKTEFNLSYNFETLAGLGVDPYSYYYKLNNQLYKDRFNVVNDEGIATIEVNSANTEEYDLWSALNSPIQVDSSFITLSKVGQILKKKTNLDILKENQSYKVAISYNFIGEGDLHKKIVTNALSHMNESVLPIGYKAQSSARIFFFGKESTSKYLMIILLIIAIIYVILSILFESFRLPLAVLILIPTSFIGVFLTFGFSSFIFDQGGFAALIMLCGIVVNSGIYLVCNYQKNLQNIAQKYDNQINRKRRLRAYIKAYNQKVRPIFLTIISTILGLLPFLIDGPQEVFWFDFAIGTISGLLVSILSLIIFFPLFVLRNKKER